MTRRKLYKTKKIISICIDDDIHKSVREMYKRRGKKLSAEINKFLIRQLNLERKNGNEKTN